MNIWQILEISPTKNVAEIRNAYAQKIRVCKPETNPEAFKALRRAYEAALRFAAADDSPANMTQPPPQDAEASTKNQYASLYTPEGMVILLFNQLRESQDAAIATMEKFVQDGMLDNMEFNQALQRTLAFNMLTLDTPFEAFLSYCCQVFTWDKQTDDDSLFGVALTNLINSLKPYRFYQYLSGLSKINSYKEAIQLNLDWEECRAAKLLLAKNSISKLVYVSFFKRKIVRVAANMLIHILEHYPAVLAKGISAPTTAWLLDYQYHHRYRTFNFCILTAFIFALNMGIGYLFLKNLIGVT